MTLEEQIQQFEQMFEQQATQAWRAAMLEVMVGTIMDTPVLDGYLRGGWQANLDEPGPGNTAPDKGGSVAVAGVTATSNSAGIENDVWFVNRYPYAYDIEFNGHSHTKAPDGMLRRNMARWRQIVEVQS